MNKHTSSWIIWVSVTIMAVCGGRAAGALTIAPGDIFINYATGKLQYTYELSFSDMESGSTKFADDVFTSSNVATSRFRPDTNGVVPTTGATSAAFVYKFDLSSVQLYGNDAYIDRVEVQDKVYLNNNSSGTEDSRITTAWSLNGSRYNPIQTANTPPTFKVPLQQNGSADIDLSEFEYRTFFYRVNFENFDAGFDAGLNAWNQANDTSTDHFKVVITVGFAGSPSGTYAGGNGSAGAPFQIATAAQLDAMGDYPGDWDKYFILVNDINMSGYFYDAALVAPDQNATATNAYLGIPFSGQFDGNNCTIRNLRFSCTGSSKSNYIGLFGNVIGGQIADLRLSEVNIDGVSSQMKSVGMLAGYISSAVITNCHVSGLLCGHEIVGGLCGAASHSTLTDCSSQAVINSTSMVVGGLAGRIYQCTLTGCRFEGSINQLYATGSQAGYYYGGLCGMSASSQVSQCFADATINLGQLRGWQVGGLFGHANNSTIEDCYSQGSIIGIDTNNIIGGLIGQMDGNVDVARCYSACALIGTGTSAAGFVRITVGSATFTSCFWDTNVGTTNGHGLPSDPDPAGIVGLPTHLMKVRSTFTASGWDFTGETVNGTEDIWAIIEGQTYPMFAGSCLERPAGDLNGDCQVDLTDFSKLAETWLQDGQIQ